MLTFIALVSLLSAYLTRENHPMFPCPSDPIEREWFAQQWRSQQIGSAWMLLGLAAVVEGLVMGAFALAT